ncbi:Lnb N-terminal periplasmic domain-containing protein [Rhodanobacter lindaniclasticus]
MWKILRYTGRGLALLLGALVALVSGIWGALALWYQLPGGDAPRTLGAVLWAVLVLVLFALAIRRRTWWPLGGYALLYALLLVWWSGIAPSNQRVWADDVARLLSGEVHGNVVTLHNVRDFHWRSDSDYDARWETQSYDLDHLVSADVVLSHWGSQAIAHMMISFGFDDGRHLVFSVEIRKRRGQEFSSIGGFFKDFEVTLIAAPESDLIRVRTNVRDEDDYLYPLTMSQPTLRALFLSYVDKANRLAARPAFYNTITTNCASMVYRMALHLDPGLPLDPRLLLTGYLPGYLYKIGALDHRLTLRQWNEQARITERARASRPGEDFSAAIRAPRPH